jgi:(E)-4-hydroxy-3-methylbut-2-enyl-diphosphate synthase
MTLRGPTLVADFKAIVEDYVARRFGAEGRTTDAA